MLLLLKNKNFYVVLIVDAIIFVIAHLLAYDLRFELRIPPKSWQNIFIMLPLIVPFKLIVFYMFGLYRGMWRYAGMDDAWRLVKASVFSSFAILVVLLMVDRFHGYSRAVFILDGLFTLLLSGGFRLSIRLLFQAQRDLTGNFLSNSLKKDTTTKKVFIVGAGDAGEKTLRELVENPSFELRVVGFVDDNPLKQGRAIHGVPVLGTIGQLKQLAKTFRPAEMLIAMPSASGTQMRRVVEACEASEIKYRTLPGLGELIDGKVSIKALRDVNFEDLLGRPAVNIDVPEIEGYLKEKCVLVTGAGGSIGSELCRQIVRFGPRQLLLMDAAETNLYSIQMDLKHHYGFNNYVTLLGNICDDRLLDGIFTEYNPHVVFHAAAYKHVPMLQRNPWQAVGNNICGMFRLMEACIKHELETFVLVSTDKAVRPTNVMGASKRFCELLMQAQNGCNGMRMMGVRFGNVVGSSGSVIPLFREQIKQGGPVTITHPEITRYFMTIPEAAQLILQAGALGSDAEIFVLEMGTPVRIADLARDLIRLSGKEPERDIEIAFTGLRPGEKLYEELVTEGEDIVETKHDKIMVLKSAKVCNGFCDIEAFRKNISETTLALGRVARQQNAAGIIALLQETIPEYTPYDREVAVLGARDDPG